jgi:hypothetical protein
MVLEPRTIFSNSILSVILHQPKRNADHRQQQPVVECHDESEFNIFR